MVYMCERQTGSVPEKALYISGAEPTLIFDSRYAYLQKKKIITEKKLYRLIILT